MSFIERGGPLQGVRVVELTKVWAGPYVGKLLAYLGAEVIRVESEGSLDVTRTFGVDDINEAPGFQAVNPQKLSAQINMKTPEGIALLLDLIGKSDILVENLRPGATARLGLDYDAVRAANPAIVYVSMGMYGNGGPLSYQTGYAPCFAALGGLSALVGYEGEAPRGMNVRYADSTFGAMAAYAALVALLHRRRKGVGQWVDVSAVESMSTMIGDALVAYALTGEAPRAQGNRHPGMAPHGVYPCVGGEWISVAIATDGDWAALADLLGRPNLAADESLRTLAGRLECAEQLDEVIAAWTADQHATELELLLQRHGIAAAKSQSSLDLIADAHLWARHFYRDVHDRDGHSRPTVGPGWKMTREAELRDAAPRLGEHNDYVFGELLGLSEQQRRDLADKGVTR